MADAVELRSIHKTYDHFVAVDHLSLSIRQGSVYGLLGPNGAGKTSTIRMMIGITMPDDGEVRLFGEKFHRKQLHRVGYLPEERGLYKKMKVIDHLIFLGRLHELSEARGQRSARWPGASGCNSADWTQKKVEELSKGMQQKIQFIAALLHDPDLVIMDEPFAGLDPANSVMLKDVLIDLKKSGKTILFSTHRMDQVERLCDAICLIDHGRAVLEGDLNKIKASYGKNHVQMQYEGDPRLEELRAGGVLQQLRQLCGSPLKAGRRPATVAAHGGRPRPHQSLRVDRAIAGRDLHRPGGDECITSGP